MGYSKIGLKSGDIITQTALDHYETGIATADQEALTAQTTAANAQSAAASAASSASSALTTATSASNAATAAQAAATSAQASAAAAQSSATATGTVGTGWTLNRFALYKVNHIVHVDLSVTRSGATIAGTASGNIGNSLIGNVGSWHPAATWSGLAPGPGGVTASVAIDANGNVYLCALPPTINCSTGNEISAGGSYYTTA